MNKKITLSLVPLLFTTLLNAGLLHQLIEEDVELATIQKALKYEGANDRDDFDRTPLHVITGLHLPSDQAEMIKFTTPEGENIETVSFEKGIAIMKLLIDNGANVRALDGNGNSSLQIANEAKLAPYALFLKHVLKELKTNETQQICWEEFRQKLQIIENQNWTNSFYDWTERLSLGSFFVLLTVVLYKAGKYPST